jgi:ADP-sugar diphosphatase
MYGENRIQENISRLGQTFMIYLAVAGCYVWLGICTLASVSKSTARKYYEEHLKKCEFVYRGVRITTDRPSVRPVFETICNAPKFLNWLNAFPLDRFDLRSINLTDVDFFGSSLNPDKLGFLKFKCDVYTKLGEPVDGIVFLRGDCVAVLIVVSDETGTEHVLLTEQPRIPTGGYKEELVAGMLDEKSGSSVFNEVLKKEIKEETSLDLGDPTNMFTPLGNYTLSGGGCDEQVHVAVWETQLTSEKIAELKTKQFGENGSNEKIRLKFYSKDMFESELLRIADAKTSLAWLLYKGHANTC